MACRRRFIAWGGPDVVANHKPPEPRADTPTAPDGERLRPAWRAATSRTDATARARPRTRVRRAGPRCDRPRCRDRLGPPTVVERLAVGHMGRDPEIVDALQGELRDLRMGQLERSLLDQPRVPLAPRDPRGGRDARCLRCHESRSAGRVVIVMPGSLDKVGRTGTPDTTVGI